MNLNFQNVLFGLIVVVAKKGKEWETIREGFQIEWQHALIYKEQIKESYR